MGKTRDARTGFYTNTHMSDCDISGIHVRGITIETGRDVAHGTEKAPVGSARLG